MPADCGTGLAMVVHSDREYTVPLLVHLRCGSRLHFEGFYELVRA
jgi:hypothetical protein